MIDHQTIMDACVLFKREDEEPALLFNYRHPIHPLRFVYQVEVYPDLIESVFDELECEGPEGVENHVLITDLVKRNEIESFHILWGYKVELRKWGRTAKTCWRSRTGFISPAKALDHACYHIQEDVIDDLKLHKQEGEEHALKTRFVHQYFKEIKRYGL